MFRYCNFVLKHAAIVAPVSGIFCTLLTLIALILKPPDFKADREAFYTWGTDISGRLNTWKTLQRKAGTFAGPLPSQIAPVVLDVTSLTRHNNLQNFSTSFHPSPTAGQHKITFSSAYCPQTQLVTIVLKAKDIYHLLSAEALEDLCQIDGVLKRIHQRNTLGLCSQRNFQGPLSLYSSLHSSSLIHKTCHETSQILHRNFQVVGDLKHLFSLPVSTFRSELISASSFENTFLSSGALDEGRSPIYTAVFLASENVTHTSLDAYRQFVSKGFRLKKLDLEGIFVNELAIAQIFQGMIIIDLLVLAPIGVILVFLLMWGYSCSFLYTSAALFSLLLAFGVSYFCYFFLYQMENFWFTNYLAAIILLGIGTDDCFVLLHTMRKHGLVNYTEINCKAVFAFRQATLAMFVTTATTAIAFLTNLITGVVAIKAFGVFATTVVLVNYILVISWLPACLVLIDRYFNSDSKWKINHIWPEWEFWSKVKVIKSGLKFKIFSQGLPWFIDKCKFALGAFLVLLFVMSTLIIGVWPKMPYAESPPQLFHSMHPIQWFIDEFHDKFNLKQPDVKEVLYMVWGVDSKDTCSPFHRTRPCPLELNSNFAITSPFLENQEKLCQHLRNRGVDSACFAHTFRQFISFSGCETFHTCFDGFRTSQRAVPANSAGTVPDGPIYDRESDEILAYVQSFELRYPATAHNCKNVTLLSEKTLQFFQEALSEINDPQMSHGWLAPTTHLAWDTLYRCDAQKVLQRSTFPSVALALGIALLVVILVTRDMKTGLASVSVIATIILTSIACLSLAKWELNVVESIIVSLGVGLSFDYTLHYAVAYQLHHKSSDTIVERVRAMSEVAGLPVLLSALGTVTAGLVFCFAGAYPFFQVGLFMVIVTSCSWLGSTFLFTSLISCFDWILEWFRDNCANCDTKFGNNSNLSGRSIEV